MRIIFVVLAIVALCTANQTETKEKRQIHYTSVPTQLKQLSQGYHGQQQQQAQHQLQQYRGGGSSEQQQQQPTSAQLGASGEEIPPEYYNAIKEFAEKQAELIQRQQLEVGMKDLLQRVGGRVEVKNYEVPFDPNNPSAVQLPQASESPSSFGKDQEPLIIERPVEYVRVQPGQPNSRQSAESGESKPQYARLSAPQLQQHQQKYGFSSEQAAYESASQDQQQAQYAHIPAAGQHYSSFSGHPLAGSTLEKEIAKLESSFQTQFKAQSQPEHLSSQPQALRFKAQPHPHQLQLNQNQFAYVAPGSTKFQSPDNYKSHVQPTSVTPSNIGQFGPTSYPQEASAKNQYVSEVQRFYNQPPKPIHQQQPTQAHYYAAQQNPNKNQYVTTEKPVEEEQEPTPKYDTSGTMKIIPAPQLQYERPSKYQQPQPIAAYYNQYKDKSTTQTHEVGRDALSLFKSAGHGGEVAPSRSSIFVSQSTGAPPVPQYIKSQAQQQYQYPSLHRQSIQQQLQKQGHQQQQQQQQHQQQQSQYQSNQQVRLPPPNGGRPLTQEEFQALVDAGYSVTAIPVPVPVSEEQYHKQQHHQQQQKHQNKRYQSLNLQREAPDVSYDVSEEHQLRSNSHAPRYIKY